MFTYCNTLDEINVDPSSGITERTDMIFSGSINYQDYNQSLESDMTSDLVAYNYYGNPSENFEFIIHLANGYKLNIEVINKESGNPWEQVGTPYNIYPPSELEDKLSFVHVNLFSSINEVLFTDSPDNSTPAGISLDVFKITSSSDNAIRCRMRNMVLYGVGDGSDDAVTINGTFVGALTF